MMHILHTPMEEVSRTPHGDERWCFKCRKRQPFVKAVMAPIVTSLDDTGAYYGPHAEIRCGVCGLMDGDCFPGTSREWAE